MSNPKQKLLIVEDDPDVAEMVSAYFHTQGYDVSAVNWGEDGVRACQTSQPDLVILDIRLPDIDGYEVARRLRKDRRTASIPIIFLTEKRERNDKLLGLELGADDYITKPFDIQELRLRVRNTLERIRQGSLTNSVTGLPEGALVDERLADALAREGWALLLVSLENLDAFRELYGFVAADDVLRAFSVMIRNAMVDAGVDKDFLGHVNQTEFLIVAPAAALPVLRERVQTRLAQSLEKVYPIKDRDHAIRKPDRLIVKTGEMSNVRGRFPSVEQLKANLFRSKR